MKILLFCFMAIADTGDDTGEAVDTASEIEDTASDTGADTEDSGSSSSEDTGEDTTESEDEDTASTDTYAEYTTAADLAGETGGFGCSTLGFGSAALFWLSALMVGFRREG